MDAETEKRLAALESENQRLKLEIETFKKESLKYQSIFNDIEESYCETDLNGHFTFFNDPTCQILGYSREELLGMDNRAYTSPETAKMMSRVFREIYATGNPVKIRDYEVIRKDGERRYVELSATLLKDEEGKAIGYHGLSRDVTERRHIEEALRESEFTLRSIFLAAPIGIGLVSNRIILRVNDRLCEMLGQAREDLIGKSAKVLYVTDEEFDLVGREKYAQISQWGTGTVETRWIRKNGQIIHVLLSSTPLDPSHLEAGVTFTALDITGRKQTEETQTRLEAQLLQAQKMEAIGTLAGGIAHDFNNILMGIQGYTSLMQMDLKPDHPHRERLRKIEEQIASGAHLTRQLLGFARGGKYEVKATNVNDLMEKSSEVFSRTKKEVSVSRRLQKDIWTVEVDQRQIEQVLLNLFINAWQAMPEGGELYLETQNAVLLEGDVKPHAVEAGRYVKISVTDTGTGMDETTSKRIFEPFFTTKAQGKGTGLGLASAYGIIKNHGGFITVYSEPGRGSTFNIYLPVSEKGKPALEGFPDQESLTGEETILIVDDEPSNLAVTKELLEGLGYRIVLAASGQEAIAIYMEKGKEIDLVILDMVMPGIGGGKTFDTLMALDPQVKVLLSSGYSANGEAQQILARGCKGFIQKPFRIHDLSRKIKEAFAD